MLMRRFEAYRYWLPSILIIVWTLLQLPTTAQTDSAVYLGSWRGNATSADGTTTGVVLVLNESNGEMSGLISGFRPGSEAPLTDVNVTGGKLLAETAFDSRLGPLSVRFDLSLNASSNALIGIKEIVFGNQRVAFAVELKKSRRNTVLQPQVEQHIGYFVGTWAFDYIGGEFPPLGIGTRTGHITFKQRGDSTWVDGEVTGNVYGEDYEEHIIIGYDPKNKSLVFKEILSNNIELLSVANWQSPIAINFMTMPVEYDGQSYQLRRVITVTSETAFRLTEDFSVNGGPFRRLGNAEYRRLD